MTEEGEEEVAYVLLARGGHLPSPAEVLSRLRGATWPPEPPEAADRAAVGLHEVRHAISRMANNLDAQALAIPEIAALSLDEIGEVFTVLMARQGLLLQHREASRDGICGEDGGPGSPADRLARVDVDPAGAIQQGVCLSAARCRTTVGCRCG